MELDLPQGFPFPLGSQAGSTQSPCFHCDIGLIEAWPSGFAAGPQAHS
jgi:hypothetical protein